MAEAMSAARLAEVRDKVTGPCSCCGYDKHDFDQPYALELLAEIDRLRAQLAEIGETREEYGALYLSWANSSHGEIRHVGPFKTANEVHEASQSTEWPLLSRDAWNLGRRLAGEWREVSE